MALVAAVLHAPGQTPRESLAGEKAAQALKTEFDLESYHLRYGPVWFQTDGTLSVGWIDNLFRSDRNVRDDVLINPEVDVKALWPISQRNILNLSLGLGYEWYLKNTQLNGNAPLVNPASELNFNVFAGDFRIRAHEKFFYQETLFYNALVSDNERFYNFNDVGEFTRWDNLAGVGVDWDLNQLILSAGYDHENFASTTERFKYLNRASELLSSSATFLVGDQARTGVETVASWNDYESEAILNDHWRFRVGPFWDMKFMKAFQFRVGAGYEMARYDALAAGSSDFDTGYAYLKFGQTLRLFRHTLTAGRENQLGDNANNLETTFAQYEISSPIIRNVTLGALLAINSGEESGGAFKEEFTYYRAGARFGYQLHKYWRADLSYDFTRKDSDLPLRDYDQNRVLLRVGFHF